MLQEYIGQSETALHSDLERLRSVHRVDTLISLIEQHELEQLNIASLVSAANERGISVHRSAIVDHSIPTLEQAAHIVELTLMLANAGRHVVFHCWRGLGRAGTLAACTLLRLGHTPQQAIAEVRAVRPGALETPEQERFVEQFHNPLDASV